MDGMGQYVYPLNVKESHQTPPRSGSGSLKGQDWNFEPRRSADTPAEQKNCSAEGCVLVVGLMKERILVPFVRIRTCFLLSPEMGVPYINQL